MGAHITYEGHFDPAVIREYFRYQFRMDVELRILRASDSTLCIHFNELGKIHTLAGFRMTEYPGNCGIVISHAAYVAEGYRGRGIGQYLHQLRIEIAQRAGYTLLQCTTQVINDNQNHILRKNGWQTVDTFINTRTTNVCYIWQLLL